MNFLIWIQYHLIKILGTMSKLNPKETCTLFILAAGPNVMARVACKASATGSRIIFYGAFECATPIPPLTKSGGVCVCVLKP